MNVFIMIYRQVRTIPTQMLVKRNYTDMYIAKINWTVKERYSNTSSSHLLFLL